jgi:hypothetical protein
MTRILNQWLSFAKLSKGVAFVAVLSGVSAGAIPRAAIADEIVFQDQMLISSSDGAQVAVRDDAVTQIDGAESNRNIIDPGSLLRIDRYVNDSFGRTFRQTGYRWTSLGVPHSNITLSRVRTYSDVISPIVMVRPVIAPVHIYPSYVYPSYAHSHVYGYGHYHHW